MSPVGFQRVVDSTQRIAVLDVAKGLGILLVVLGHNDVFRERAPAAYEAIYLFHMPLFFFLAGVTFRGGSVGAGSVGGGSVGDVIRKRARSLLVPYFAMSALAVALAWQAGGGGASGASSASSASGVASALSELGGVLYGTGQTIRFVPLWFLPCLFVTAVFVTLLLSAGRAVMKSSDGRARHAGSAATSSAGAVAGATACAIAGACLLSAGTFALPPFADSSGRPVGLPWSLDLVPFVSALFILGALTARLAFGRDREISHAWLIALGGTVVLGLLATTGASLDLNFRRMTNPIAVIAATAAGIATIVALSHAVTRYAVISRVFAYLGSASLVILMLHAPLQRRTVDVLQALGLNVPMTVIVSIVLTVGVIAAIDYWILRRVRAFGWVVYPRRAAASAA
jgi:fucose 4-O-acetylase-like acetyltransferase